MRKKFTTYIEEDSIAWIKREALEREVKEGKKVSAADILNELIEKEINMKFEKPEYFVSDQYGTSGDEYIFSTAQEAVEYAEAEWNHLVPQDKNRHVITAGVREKGTFDYDVIEIFGGD